jgi:hypothetical protein
MTIQQAQSIFAGVTFTETADGYEAYENPDCGGEFLGSASDLDELCRQLWCDVNNANDSARHTLERSLV